MVTDGAATMWSIHDGRNNEAQSLFLEHNHIALGWNIVGRLDALPNDQDAFKAKVIETHASDVAGAPQIAGQLRHFVYDVRVGDIAVYRPEPAKNVEALIFIGRITGPYLYNPYIHEHFHHVRRVEWLRSVPVSQFSEGAVNEQRSAMTLSKIATHAQEFLAALQG